jgi:hypothetical protein
MQPSSSSHENAKWIGSLRRAAFISGSIASATPMKPFMSQAPRPKSLPSRTVGSKGSLSQSWPLTGTTSVWPESTMPPCVAPSAAGMVAKRFAFLPVGS